MDAINAEMIDIKAGLSPLCNGLETGELELDDLAPRINELRARKGELTEIRVPIEADVVVR